MNTTKQIPTVEEARKRLKEARKAYEDAKQEAEMAIQEKHQARESLDEAREAYKAAKEKGETFGQMVLRLATFRSARGETMGDQLMLDDEPGGTYLCTIAGPGGMKLRESNGWVFLEVPQMDGKPKNFAADELLEPARRGQYRLALLHERQEPSR